MYRSYYQLVLQCTIAIDNLCQRVSFLLCSLISVHHPPLDSDYINSNFFNPLFPRPRARVCHPHRWNRCRSICLKMHHCVTKDEDNPQMDGSYCKECQETIMMTAPDSSKGPAEAKTDINECHAYTVVLSPILPISKR